MPLINSITIAFLSLLHLEAMPLFKHMDDTAAIEEAAKRNHILAQEKSAENKVGFKGWLGFLD
jgi:hypothetical protein